ncbi:SKP1/ASK1-interacting protein 2 [Artemisia annua]|uniref:SKP1/ASK1-interacting protein 2 n=1 Tax=Artemisia annua TaxID=35608 RepID=A0A2U1KJH5_ARTAN|nr:SKP1/ASK1-interacting protein 2 [Artemisia annua]
MGQSSSSHPQPSPPWSTNRSNSSSFRSIHHKDDVAIEYPVITNASSYIDYTSEIPDDCLAFVFQFLTSGDRKRCSLVSRRWLLVEGQSRHRLALNAQSEIVPLIPVIFSRFDSVTKLSLRCDRRSVSIDDNGLEQISLRCVNLTRLKLRGCREVTDVGMAALGFRIGGFSLCMYQELYNGQFFGPLISGAKNLKTLKLLRCLGDWDSLLEMIAVSDSLLSEVHLERLQVSDVGLSALSNCSNLEILHIVKTPDCTNAGVVAIAERCKYLRKLHIDGWKTNRIGNEALIAIARHSVHLQELVLIGVNPSSISLEAIASNCQKLERLALCGSETIADTEISCIASKCVALKKLCIKGCPVSDEGIEAFAWGCPNLIKIKVKKCRNVTGEVGDWLRARRGSLVVNLDVCAVEVENIDASASEGAQEDVADLPTIMNDVAVAQPEPLATSSSCRGSVFRTRFGLFGGRGLVSSTFRKWSIGNSSSTSTS